MIASFPKSALAKVAFSALTAMALTACGGGGGGSDSASGGNGAGVGLAVNGTVARGAAISNATVRLSCANGAELSATSGTDGSFVTNQAAIVYPCIGTATAGTLTYRGILFSSSTANFTPLTDLLVQTVLAASASGAATARCIRAPCRCRWRRRRTASASRRSTTSRRTSRP